MGEFKPVDSIEDGRFDASFEKSVSETDALLLERVLENTGIDAHDLEDPNKAVEIEKMLNEEVEALASARPKSSLNDLLRKGKKLGLPLITAAAILIGASCAKEKEELPSENQQTSSTVGYLNNENNNTIEVQEVGDNAALQQQFFEALSEIEYNGAMSTIRSKESLDFKKIDDITIDDVSNGVNMGDWLNVTSDSNPANKYKALAMGRAIEMWGGGWYAPVKSESSEKTGSLYEKKFHTKGFLYEVTYSNPLRRLKGYVIYPSPYEELSDQGY